MARKKVKLAWISNDAARRATFKKRKMGLMKKVHELSTLCGVSACAVIYGSGDPQPDVWPSPAEAHRILSKFKSLPAVEQTKKMMNQEGFLKDRIAKLKENLKKLQKENRQIEMSQLMKDTLAGKKSLDQVGIEDLSDLAWFVDDKMKVIHARMEKLRRMAPGAGPSAPVHHHHQVVPAPLAAADPRDRHQHYHHQPGSSSSSAAVFAANHHHHHHHPAADQMINRMTPVDMAMESLKRSTQPAGAWFMDPQEHISYDHMLLPYGDWPNNPFYP